MITTIKIRQTNALFHGTRLFSTLSITGKAEAGTLFYNTYPDDEKYKSYLTLIVFQNRCFLQCQ